MISTKSNSQKKQTKEGLKEERAKQEIALLPIFLDSLVGAKEYVMSYDAKRGAE